MNELVKYVGFKFSGLEFEEQARVRQLMRAGVLCLNSRRVVCLSVQN